MTTCRICVSFKDGTNAYLHKDAVLGRDEAGEIGAVLKTTRRASDAWRGHADEKDEIIRHVHRKMASGFCQQVSYLY